MGREGVKPTSKPRVKICCISTVEEAWMAIACGASAIGLVSAMPSGPGVVSEELIATIAATVPPGVSSFLLTSKQDAASIIAQHRCCCTTTIQIVDSVPTHVYAQLRQALPEIKLVQVIHMRGQESIGEAERVAPHVDALLLDSGNPDLAVKELGGTGRTHNWTDSRKIRERVDVPLFLAGGLHAENVGNAIAEVKPFAVDVCSGVRTNGRLDRSKLTEFCKAVSAARNPAAS